MWKLWVHTDYDHLHILLTLKECKLQPQTISLGNNNTFCIKPIVMRVTISEK